MFRPSPCASHFVPFPRRTIGAGSHSRANYEHQHLRSLQEGTLTSRIEPQHQVIAANALLLLLLAAAAAGCELKTKTTGRDSGFSQMLLYFSFLLAAVVSMNSCN